MDTIPNQSPHAALNSLEAAAVSARGGFACMFSTSDDMRRADHRTSRAGSLRPPRSRWPLLVFAGCALIVAGAVLLLN